MMDTEENNVVDSTRRSGRTVTLTERGAAYEVEILGEQLRKLAKKVQESVDDLNGNPEGRSAAETKAKHEKHQQLVVEVLAISDRLRKNEKAKDLLLIAKEIETAAVTVSAMQVNDDSSEQDQNVEIKVPVLVDLFKDLSLGAELNVDNHGISITKDPLLDEIVLDQAPSFRSEGSIVASLNQIVKSIHSRLSLQMELVKQVLSSNDESLLKTESNNMDRMLQELSDANTRLMETLQDEKKLETQANFMYSVDATVFRLKQSTCAWIISQNKRLSERSKSSGSRRSSSSSSGKKKGSSYCSKRSGSNNSLNSIVIQQRANTAILKAEAAYLENTLTEKVQAEAKRKEEEIRSKLAEVQLRIIKSEAREEVYDAADAADSNRSNGPIRNLAPKKPKNKMLLHRADVNSNDITEIVRMIKAPTVDIDCFSGNPLDFQYFMLTFKDTVESTVTDQRGRLMRLLKYTSGNAKDLITHCVHEKSACYDKAVNLLTTKYGDPDKIAELYLRELREWSIVKATDAEGLEKLHRFLIKCETHKKTGHLPELDSTSTIRSIILKLHYSLHDKWNVNVEKIKRSKERKATFQDLIQFIDFHASLAANPCYSFDALSEAKKEKIKVNSTRKNEQRRKEDEKDTMKTCCICMVETHDPDLCSMLLAKNLSERKEMIMEKKLCFACLKPISKGHVAKSCTQQKVCLSCNGKHPTSLHDPKKEIKTTAIRTAAIRKSRSSEIISLCVVPVYVSHTSDPTNTVLCYAMLDNDSTGCFGETSLLEKIAPSHLRKALVSVETINGITEQDTTALDGLIVRCADKHQELHPSQPINLPTTFSSEGIPIGKNEIPTPSNIRHWKHLKLASKALSEFTEDLPFGLLIGGNCPKALEPLDVIRSESNGPYAYRTSLGWCVVGPIASECENSEIKCHFTKLQSDNEILGVAKTYAKMSFPVCDAVTKTISPHYFSTLVDVKDQYITRSLHHMYDVEFNETNGEDDALSNEDEAFIRIMNQSIRKDHENHYVLPLPFREDAPNLPNNRKQAMQRLMAVKRKMVRDQVYKEQYVEFIDKMLKKGHARQCTPNSSATIEGAVWYLCHHGVHRSGKSLRVVMDCSANFHGRCLNDELLQGPDLTNHMLGVLLRFRKNIIAFTADIEGMFLQVRVPEDQQQYLRFLWWPNGDTSLEPQDFKMCVHIFGAISSPSCANFALRQTAIDNKVDIGENISNTILRDFYVDDLLKSVSEVHEALSMIPLLQEMCHAGGFNLTKFVSNSVEVVTSIPPEHRAPSIRHYELSRKLPIERALGVTWCVESDTLSFRICLEDVPLTRRGMLSTISSIYDVFGLVSPFLLRGRKILQEITSGKQSWDDPVPTHIASQWEEWRQELHLIENINVTRCFKSEVFGESVDTQVHNFGDAAEKPGYGVASFIRQVNKAGEIEVCLVMGKSRVTPLKPVTVPRLELTAAELATKVGITIKKELKIDHLKDFYWADSMVTLGYIQNDVRRFKIFVANRAKRIRDSTKKEQWRYIASNDNPAHLATKGISLKDSDKTKEWFRGPDFLYKAENTWVEEEILPLLDDDPELRTAIYTNITRVEGDTLTIIDLLEQRISSWDKWKRVLAIVLRFIAKCKKEDTHDDLCIEDIQNAERLLIKMIQTKYLANHIAKVREQKAPESKAIAKLNPFIDQDGILRVGGRLGNCALIKLRHPCILPKKCISTDIIISWHHRKVNHLGRTTTTNELRSNGFWVLNITSQVSRILKNCFRCRLYRGKVGEQLMSELPAKRTEMEGPFTYCGVDIFGPFRVKEGRKEVKRYGSVFTCFSSRAIHLEVVHKLDTDSFLLALRRFTARRGPVRSIRSDNGTNFVGAQNQYLKALESMDEGKIRQFLLTKECDWESPNWERNPPISSHMGGVWERMIRSVRSILTSLIDEHGSRLNDEALHTFLTEVEAVVNSRPIAVETLSDPDIEPLTPNHLLTMKMKVVMPPPGNFIKADLYCQKRWRSIQYLTNEFWKRWSREYLSSLQKRQKWTSENRNFTVNDIVLMKVQDLPRNKWLIARVIEVFPSKDGLVRSVKVRIAKTSSEITRSITKLVLLIAAKEE